MFFFWGGGRGGKKVICPQIGTTLCLKYISKVLQSELRKLTWAAFCVTPSPASPSIEIAVPTHDVMVSGKLVGIDTRPEELSGRRRESEWSRERRWGEMGRERGGRA